MPSGRPSKPTEIKRKLGNPGQRKLPEQSQVQLFDPISKVPEPARPLLKYGREFWDKVWANGLQWISPNTDAEILLMTCELIDERWN
ncbi:MAG: phage terminase small subunit P27 family, partial [Betaproteobacteria bacterium]|nr:phage terminase small subunit P27 family [Betaproteobacteria bacterium]